MKNNDKILDALNYIKKYIEIIDKEIQEKEGLKDTTKNVDFDKILRIKKKFHDINSGVNLYLHNALNASYDDKERVNYDNNIINSSYREERIAISKNFDKQRDLKKDMQKIKVNRKKKDEE